MKKLILLLFLFVYPCIACATGGPGVIEGTWIIEAEDGILTPPMEIVIDDKASMYKAIQVPNTSPNTSTAKAVYTFEVLKEDEYIIWGRVMAPSTVDNSFYYKLDDGTQAYWRINTIGTNWIWNRANSEGVNSIHFLKTGEHTLEVINRENGTSMDKIIITNDLDYVPIGKGILKTDGIILLWDSDYPHSTGYRLYYYDDSNKPADETPVFNDPDGNDYKAPSILNPEVRKNFWAVNIEGGDTKFKSLEDLNLEYNKEYRFFVTMITNTDFETGPSNIIKVVREVDTSTLFPERIREVKQPNDPLIIFLNE